MSPASETASSWSTVVGNSENATAISPESTRGCQLARAPDAPDEIHPWVGARVADAEQRAEDLVLDPADVEEASRSRCPPGWSRTRCQCPGQVDDEAAGLRAERGSRGRRDPTRWCLRSSRNPVGGSSAQVPDHPVVGQDPEVAGGEQDRQEPVVLLVAPMARVGPAPLPSGPPGAGRAVMAVRHVGQGYGAERRHVGGRIPHPPPGVPHSGPIGEIEQRLPGGCPLPPWRSPPARRGRSGTPARRWRSASAHAGSGHPPCRAGSSRASGSRRVRSRRRERSRPARSGPGRP